MLSKNIAYRAIDITLFFHMFQFLFNNNLTKYTQTINNVKKISLKYSKYSNEKLQEEHTKLKRQNFC